MLIKLNPIYTSAGMPFCRRKIWRDILHLRVSDVAHWADTTSQGGDVGGGSVLEKFGGGAANLA